MIEILICDDDPDILEVTSIALQAENWSTEKLNNLENVVDFVMDIKPDVILMDLSMPGMRGDEAIRLLKKTKETTAIPVILFSASKDLPSIAERLEVPFIQKPFDLVILREMIRNLAT